MKTLLYLLLLSPLGLFQAPAADTERILYYVQLVRGNNEEKSPDAASKPVGPKLSQELRRVFAWKSYWEASRHQVEVGPSRKVRVKLNADRELEIDLGTMGKARLTAYSEGKPVSEITRLPNEKLTIMGGDRDRQSAWFIVVRRDKPTED